MTIDPYDLPLGLPMTPVTGEVASIIERVLEAADRMQTFCRACGMEIKKADVGAMASFWRLESGQWKQYGVLCCDGCAPAVQQAFLRFFIDLSKRSFERFRERKTQ